LGLIKMKKTSFTKMAGTGNDFIVFDNRMSRFKGNEAELFAALCLRRIGIGADGVLLLSMVDDAIRMRYYNADGREAEMCGNAARCVAFYAYYRGWVKEPSFVIQAMDGPHPVTVEKNDVILEMKKPADYEAEPGILNEPQWHEGGALNTGVPQYVIFADHIAYIDVPVVAPTYRYHNHFQDGVNVNFVKILNSHEIQVRTFERGVEDETLSCGTGCVASALIASKKRMCDSPVKVSTKGGELTVAFDKKWNKVTLAGKVRMVYDGSVVLSDFIRK